MAKYQIDEATFDLPDDWRDQTLNVFTTGGPEPPLEATLVISRSTLEPGRHLVDHVEAEMEKLKSKLPKFRLLGKRRIELAGRTALEAEVTWYSDGRPVHQRQQFLQVENRVLAFITTAPVKIADAQNQQVDAILASLTLRE